MKLDERFSLGFSLHYITPSDIQANMYPQPSKTATEGCYFNTLQRSRVSQADNSHSCQRKGWINCRFLGGFRGFLRGCEKILSTKWLSKEGRIWRFIRPGFLGGSEGGFLVVLSKGKWQNFCWKTQVLPSDLFKGVSDPPIWVVKRLLGRSWTLFFSANG